MDYRDSARSPPERSWNSRDDGRKDDRDLFYRGRSPMLERNHSRRPARSRSPANIDRYEPRPRVRDDYGGGRDRDRERDRERDRDHRDREDRRRPVSPPPNIDRYIPGQSLHASSAPHNSMAALPPSHYHASQRPALTNPIPDPLKLPYQVGFSFFSEWWRGNEKIKEELEAQRTGRRPERSRAAKEPEEREREKARIQAAYDAYKEEVQAKMAQSFVKQHKEEQWFIERYVPEVRDPIRQELGEVRKSFYAQWEQDLENGLFDDFTLEGIHRNDAALNSSSSTSGGGGAATADKEEGETTVNELMGVGDLVPATSAADIRDATLSAPTLLIKTIAPTVSRQNLEAFCRENLGEGEGGYRWLSLSDPNPSKRYHRIGWIMLNPGPEGGFPVLDEDGNVDTENPQTISVAAKAQQAVDSKTVKDDVRGDFTIHVGVHNPPSQLRKKALWDLFSAPERIDRDLHLVQRLVAKFENEVDPGMNAILRVEEKVDELKASGRLQPARISSGLAAAAASKLKKKKLNKTKKRNNRALDMDVSLDFDTGMDDQHEEDEEEEDEEEDVDVYGDEDGEEREDGGAEEDVDDEYLMVQKKQLDLLIEYLRRVFNFCFFCVFESDSVHELTRKCPGGHLRRPRSMLSAAAREVARATAHDDPFPAAMVNKRRATSASGPGGGADAEEGELTQDGNIGGGGGGGGGGAGAAAADRKGRTATAKSEQQLLRAYNWVKTFEEKIHQILEPGSADLRKYGGKPLEEALSSDMGKYVKQEDEHKYRCKLPECTKLFKEEHFWRKHVEKRHAEWYDALKAELELVNAYAADPSHIAPSRTDANSNGHFPSATGQTPTGTPRGFNLGNYNMNAGLPSVPGFPVGGGGGSGIGSPMSGGGAAAGYNMYNPIAMQVPGSWQAPSGGPGPIRRGGGGGAQKYNNSRPGPYDRRPMRWHPDAGLTGGPSHLFNNMGGGGGGRNSIGGGSSSGGGGGGSGRGSQNGGGSRNGGGAMSGSGVVSGSGSGGSGGGGPRGDSIGPHEATQGRTIKSYEDLDQVGNGGGGELNY